MKISNFITENHSRLEKAGIDSARLDLLVMLEEVAKQPREWLLANQDTSLNGNQLQELSDMVDVRIQRRPLAQIIGQRQFYGRDFKVTADVLVPRPETEVMVEEAVKIIPKNAKVLELGTGSGCIAISLKLERPDLNILATDVSSSALKIAKSNAKNLKAEVEFMKSDLFKAVPNQKFAAILANLPYVPVSARRQPEIEFEPDVALYGGDDGLELYIKFFEKLSVFLKKDGICLVEYSPTQHKLVREILSEYKLNSEPISEYVYSILPRRDG